MFLLLQTIGLEVRAVTEQQRYALASGLLLLAVILVVVGFLRDEFSFVLHRAINICLECIGIG